MSAKTASPRCTSAVISPRAGGCSSLTYMMVVSTGTRRSWPVRDVGPLTDEYSLVSDWDDQWLTGGSESDVIAEAHLDPDSIFDGIKRFADDRKQRIGGQASAISSLG